MKTPDLSWSRYQSNFGEIADTNSAESINEMVLKMTRLIDRMPVFNAFIPMFKRARKDLAIHLKAKKADQRSWTKSYIALLTLNARLEGAIAAFLTSAEEDHQDYATVLNLRLGTAIDLVDKAVTLGLLVFPDPSQLDLEKMKQVLMGEHENAIVFSRVKTTKPLIPKIQKSGKKPKVVKGRHKPRKQK